jgi:hypothetical protein
MNEEAIRVVREIEAKYEAKWGPIQSCCGFYQDYCRCIKAETVVDLQEPTTE